jgi:hypothetical protein
MATDDDFDTIDQDQDGDTHAIREIRARNRQLAKQHKEQQQRLEAAEAAAREAEIAKRELAFVKAGVNPDDPASKYFVKGYDGELTVEAIKAAATEARLLGPAQDAQQQQRQQTNQDLQVHDQIADASRNGTLPQAEQEYMQKLAAARNPAEVMALAVQFDPQNAPTE